MIKLEWKLNGRTVRPDQVATELAKNARQAVMGQVETAIRSVVCPVHGRRATQVRSVRGSGSQLSFEYQACCDTLKAAITQSMR